MNTDRKYIEGINDNSSSFKEVVLEGLADNSQLHVETLCEVQGNTQLYPVLFARTKHYDPSKPTVFIAAGMHGDEPAGVHVAVRFLTGEASAYTDRFNFVVFPCLNPTGFDTNTHDTEHGMNLNSHFNTQDSTAVIQALEKKVQEYAPSTVLAFDLHEDNSGERLGCYVYELLSNDTNRIAHNILQVLDPEDVYRNSIVHMDLAEDNTDGVIQYHIDESDAFSTALEEFLKIHGADHAMTIETPTAWPLEKRIETHLAIIRQGLELSDQKTGEEL